MAAEIVKPLHELHEKLVKTERFSAHTYAEVGAVFSQVEKDLLKKFENESPETKAKIRERLHSLKESWLEDIKELKRTNQENRGLIKEKSFKKLAHFKHEIGIEKISDPKLQNILEGREWVKDKFKTGEIDDYEGRDFASQTKGVLENYLLGVRISTPKDSRLADDLYSDAVSVYKGSTEFLGMGKILDLESLKSEFKWRSDIREIEKTAIPLSAQSYGIILGLFKIIDEDESLSKEQKKEKKDALIATLVSFKDQLKRFEVIPLGESHSWVNNKAEKEHRIGQEQADFLLEKLYTQTPTEKPATTPTPSPDITNTTDATNPNKPAETTPPSPEQAKISALHKTIEQLKMDEFVFKNEKLTNKNLAITQENFAELENLAKEELSKALIERKESLINKTTAYRQEINRVQNLERFPFEGNPQWTTVLASLSEIETAVSQIKTGPTETLEELRVSWNKLKETQKNLAAFEKIYNPLKEKIPKATPSSENASKRPTQSGSYDMPGPIGMPERAPGSPVPRSAPTESREKSDDPYAKYWQYGRITSSFIFKDYPGELTINPLYVSPGENLVLRNDQGRPISVLYGGEKVTLADRENAWEVKPLGHVEGLRFIKIKVERGGREFIAWTSENGLKKAEPEMIPSERSTSESREFERVKIEGVGEIHTEYLEALTIIERDAEKLGGADFTLRFNNQDLKFHISKLGPKNYVVSWANGKAQLRFNSVEHFLNDLNSGNFMRTLTYIHLNNPKYYEKYKESIGPLRRELKPFSMKNMKPGEEIKMELDWKGAYAGDGNAEVRLRALPHGLIGFSIKRRYVGLDGKTNIRKGFAANFNDLVNQISFARYEAENYDEDLEPSQLTTYNQQKKMLNELRNPNRFYYPLQKDDQGNAFQTGRPLSFGIKDYRTIQAVLDWDQTGKRGGNAIVTVRLGKDNMLYYKVDYPNKSFHQAEKRVGSFYELMANIDDAKNRAAQKRKEQPQKSVSQKRSWRQRLRTYKRTASK